MARQLFLPDMEEPKRSFITWQPTGRQIGWLDNESESASEGVTTGRSRSESRGVTTTEGESTTESTSVGRSYAETDGEGMFEAEGASSSTGITMAGDDTVQFFPLFAGENISHRTEGEGENRSSGRSSFSAVTQTNSASLTKGTTRSFSRSESHHTAEGSSESTTRTHGATRGRTQVLLPEPTFQTSYQLQEQDRRLAWKLKKLPTAEAIIETPTGNSIHMVVPRVRPGVVPPPHVERLKGSLFARQPSALPPHEAEQEIEARQRDLLLPSSEAPDEPGYWH